MSTFRFGLGIRAWTPPRELLRRAAQSYRTQLKTKPLRTQLVTSTLLWTVGDSVSQRLEGAEKQDLWRTLRCSLFGLFVAGPVYHWWFPRLDAMLKGHTFLKTSGQVVAAKVAVDQLVFEPPLLASTFIFLGALELKKPREIADKLRDDFGHTFLVDCLFWTPLQALNFRYIPLPHQALFVNAACVLWNGYVSFVNHRKAKHDAEAAAAKALAAAKAAAAASKAPQPQPALTHVGRTVAGALV